MQCIGIMCLFHLLFEWANVKVMCTVSAVFALVNLSIQDNLAIQLSIPNNKRNAMDEYGNEFY